jgi:ribosome-associated protein
MARYHNSAMNDEILSKTKKKQQMHALQALGVELVELSRERLAQIELPERLMIEIREAQRITSHEGRRRQMQFIGKLMRETEEELIAAARERLAAWKGLSKAETTRMHTMERWRDRLVADDAALTEFLQLHSGVDAQTLRNLIRNARKEHAEGKPPRAFREIFRVVRETLEGRT